MAKRFTNSGKWQTKWFRGLSPTNKLFWHYLNDSCNHAGIWEVDFGLASYQLGEELNEEETKKTFADKITVFDNGERWIINDFVEFQYGELQLTNNAHKSVMKILRKHGLEGLLRGWAGHKDKDQDQDQDKAKEVDKEKDKDKARVYSLPSQYCSKHDFKHSETFCPKCVEEF